MIELKWSPVSPQALTADGSAQGLVQLADTAGFYTKQIACLKGTALPDKIVQVKRVLSPTLLIVGTNDGRIASWLPLDITGYTLASGATIQAGLQDRTALPPEKEHYSAIYESDPVVADRIVQVDKHGNFYDKNNPMPIIFDGTVSIGDVAIVDPDNGNHIKVNSDGSINVIVEDRPSPNIVVVSTYNEIVAVPAGATSTIVTYTVPVGKQAILQRCPVSGDNVARYDLQINGASEDTLRTMFGGDLTGQFDFTSGNESGLVLNPGDIITVSVIHQRPFPGTFEARIQVVEFLM